jgi:siroheme synthase
MGIGACRATAAALCARGWRADTAAAIVSHASLPEQRVWRGTLAALSAGAGPDATGPGTLVIGDVVRFAAERAEPDATAASLADAADERAYVSSR